MNFLLRSTQPVVPAVSIVSDHKAVRPIPQPTATLEGLIAQDPFPNQSAADAMNTGINQAGVVDSLEAGSTSNNQFPVGKHTDVSEDDGWITIPYKELPDDWADAASIQELRSFDRSFIFPGEQIHILVCLAASKRESEVITPFRVAAVMSKNGKLSSNKEQSIEISEKASSSLSLNEVSSSTPEGISGMKAETNAETVSSASFNSCQDNISATESLLRMEYHKQQTESVLDSFRNSNFFARIAEADEQLWSKRNNPSTISKVMGDRSHLNPGSKRVPNCSVVNAFVDKGRFDGNTSGGVARDTIKCFSLSNGDIVVLLEVNVGVSNLKDPVLEVTQFEKYQYGNSSIKNHNNSSVANCYDPYCELLNWLLPLDRTLPPRSLSPPLSSTVSQKSTSPASGSQIFSFGHFRSYSMPLLPQVTGSPSSMASISCANSSFDLEDIDSLSSEKDVKSQDTRNVDALSFRGVPLEPERFSTHCGLEGIYLPGRRWRRKLEIIQPVEIHSFAADCNTEDLLCVQIKNVCPPHMPDIAIYLDAIAIISEDESSKGGPPLSLPIASIESGSGHSLPNLVLRRGEEHSFILKLALVSNKYQKGCGELCSPSAIADGMMVSSTVNQFAVLVSCRCNYTESKLFFKQRTDWRPRIARDLMISIASENCEKSGSPNVQSPELPVKVLTLKATNLTFEDLTLTVLSPETAVSPSVLSLTSTPKMPINSSVFQGHSSVPNATKSQKERSDHGNMPVDQSAVTSDVISSNSSGFTHLWLQSAVPLGCIPALSSGTVKLELLPLTNGIITLDTLQLAVKEKGLKFIPEHSLKINATSSISAGIL